MVDIEKIPFTHCKWFKQSSALPCQYYLDDGLCSLKWQFRCTEYLRHTEVTLSHSSLQEYTHCHLKYYLSHIMGLELIEKPWTMVQGGIAHEVLSGLHSNNPSKSNLDFNSIINIYAQKHRNPNADKPDVWPYAMRGFFEAYVELGNAKSKGLTEYYWKCGKVDNPSVIGYIDLIKPDLKHAREFKWSGSPDWYRKFTVQDQVGIYFLGVPQLESMTTRILVVPNSKEGLRLGNGEDLSGYQDRVKREI